MTRFRFLSVEADGEHVVVHTVVTFGPLEHPISVRLTEDDAQSLIAKVQAAIARLGRTRLPAAKAVR
jgi:hypothetical protein